MKKIILLLTVSLSINIFAQGIPQLELKQTGVESIVVDVDGKNASELYNKALNWVQETYKNPDEVLKAKIENDKIRLNGYSDSSWHMDSFGLKNTYYGYKYTIEASFKDGKYKFDYLINELIDPKGEFNFSYDAFWKKNGTLRKQFVASVKEINEEMNKLSQSYYEYVSGKTQKKNDDW